MTARPNARSNGKRYGHCSFHYLGIQGSERLKVDYLAARAGKYRTNVSNKYHAKELSPYLGLR